MATEEKDREASSCTPGIGIEIFIRPVTLSNEKDASNVTINKNVTPQNTRNTHVYNTSTGNSSNSSFDSSTNTNLSISFVVTTTEPSLHSARETL